MHAPDANAAGDKADRENVWEYRLDDFLVLARPDISGLYILSPSARLIWDLYRNGQPIPEIIREFASICHIPTEIAANDVRRTLDDWHSGLLSPRQPPPSAVPIAPRARPDPVADCFSADYFVHGRSIRVSLQTADLAQEIGPRLQALPSAISTADVTFRVSEGPEGFSIFRDNHRVGTEVCVTAARGLLLQEIVQSCRNRESLAVFHAGACGFDSRCVVFPAGTQSGKTTLSAVLMRMGLTFFSDDSVMLERDTLSVPAMPFGLMIREGSWDLVGARFPELHNAPIVSRFGRPVRFLSPLAAEGSTHSDRVSAIVFVQFDPAASNELTTLDTLQALLRLQESGFWVAHDEASIRAFLRWLHSMPSYTLTYSDVDQAAATIRSLLR